MLTKIVIAVAGALIVGSAWMQAGLAQEADTMAWNIRISGDRMDTCEDVWQLDGTAILTEIACAAYGSGTTSGSIDPDTGAFALSGVVGGYQMQSQGTLSLDGMAIGGSWSVTDPPVSGTFVGQLLQIPPPTETPPSTASVTPAEPTSLSATATSVAPSLPDTGASGSGGIQVWYPVVVFAGLVAAIVLSFSALIWSRKNERWQ